MGNYTLSRLTDGAFILGPAVLRGSITSASMMCAAAKKIAQEVSLKAH